MLIRKSTQLTKLSQRCCQNT